MSAADARVMATAFADDVDVPGLAVALRQPALRVLHLLLEVHLEVQFHHVKGGIPRSNPVLPAWATLEVHHDIAAAARGDC